MRSIMITGVAGVGKSTLAQALSTRYGWPGRDYADFMLEAMGQADKDSIRHLTMEEKRHIYDEVEVKLSRLFAPKGDDDQYFVLENHLTIMREGVVVTFPVDDYHGYNMAALVVVEADSLEVLRRRQSDPTRRRAIESIETIDRQQATNREQARIVSSRLGVPMCELHNGDGAPPIEDLVAWIEQTIVRKTST